MTTPRALRDTPSAVDLGRQLLRRCGRRPHIYILCVISALVVMRLLLAAYTYALVWLPSLGEERDGAHINMREKMLKAEPNVSFPIDVHSTAALTSDAFPAELASTEDVPPLDMVYPEADPHRGELSEDILRLLESPPPMKSPPHPREVIQVDRAVWEPHLWTLERNGSRTSPEDAMHPERQPMEAEWRLPPYNAWSPPLANLTQSPPQTPHVQFPFADPTRHSGMVHNESRDAVLAYRQRLVRNAFLRSWQGYKDYAWGADELCPVSRKASNNFNGWGATIIDALDTLLIMDLPDEYNLAREHVHDVDFHIVGGKRSAYGRADGRIPVFETSIRYLGGLLSAFDLTGDSLMRERSEELAQLLLPAFETRSGLPVGRMHLDDAEEYTPEHPRGSRKSIVIAEATSMLLEFTRLWQVTGNRTYFDRVQRVTDYLDLNLTSKSERGTLLTTVLNPESGALFGKYTLGGQVDSYYEYLIKEHQLLGGRLEQYPRMYGEAMDSAFKHLFKEVEVVPGAPLVVASETWDVSPYYAPKLEHLSCFAGAMLALGGRLLPERTNDLNVARRFTESCYWAYNTTLTGLGGEYVQFYRPDDEYRFKVLVHKDGTRHRGKPTGDPYTGVSMMLNMYQNRPETIESVLYMWRISGDPIWQERGWQMFTSWMTHCLTESGISALSDVDTVPAPMTDSMESFTLAETLKYYYLLFSPPELVSLDDFVFTTEAHPLLLPHKGKWARAGDVPAPLKKWMPPAPPPPGVYRGGEGGPRSGLSHRQKYELLQRTGHISPDPPFSSEAILEGLNSVLRMLSSKSAASPMTATSSATTVTYTSMHEPGPVKDGFLRAHASKNAT